MVRDRRGKLDYPPTHFHWFSGPAFHQGIETHQRDEAPVRVYDPEKRWPQSFRKLWPIAEGLVGSFRVASTRG